MTRMRFTLAALLTVAAVALPVSAAAQIEIRDDQDSWGRPVFRVGQEFVLKAGTEVREAVVIFGDATIDGHVDQDVVVVLGKAQLGSTAVVEPLAVYAFAVVAVMFLACVAFGTALSHVAFGRAVHS